MSGQSDRDLVISVSLIAGIPLFLYSLSTINGSELGQLLNQTSIYPLIGFGVSALSTHLVLVLIWGILLAGAGVRLHPVKLFHFRMIGDAISYVTPGPRIGGEITQARVCKRDFSEKLALITAITERFCHIIAGLLFDIVAIGIAIRFVPVPGFIQYLFYMLLVIVLIVFVTYHIVLKNDVAIIVWIVECLNNIGVLPEDMQFPRAVDAEKSFMLFIKENSQNVFYGVLLGLVSKMLLALQIMFAAQVISVSLPIAQAMLAAAAVDIAYSLPSYMGLGFLEAGQVSVFTMLGFPGGMGVIIAMLTRIKDLVFSGYGLLMLWYYR